MSYLDLNNIQFYEVCNQEIGKVTQVIVEGQKVSLLGTASVNKNNHNKFLILLLDKYKRYLSCTQVPEEGIWKAEMSLENIRNVPPQSPLNVYVLDVGDNVARRIDIPKNMLSDVEQAMREYGCNASEIPSFSRKLEQLIIEATSCKYVSRSICDSILTGNNYQTIDLGDVMYLGGRPKRTNLISTIDFRGKKVLDIGANTGEISRYIRRLGASLVDGYEYDSFFVEIGRMINAYTGITRVSLYQGDASNPEFYSEKYDVVVALAVYVYIKNVLDKIAEITDVMLFETHTLDQGLDFYLEKITPYFPYFQHMGYTDFHKELTNSRALLLFSKDEGLLDKYIKNDYILLPDSDKQNVYSFEEFNHRSFFYKYGNCSNSDFWDIIKRLEVDCKNLNYRELELEQCKYQSSVYLSLLLLGYVDYERNGYKVDENNRFYKFFAFILNKGLIPDMRYLLSDKKLLLRKVEHKYRDFRCAKEGRFREIPPLTIKHSESGVFQFKTETGGLIKADNIDGHHRLFLAWLFGEKRVMYHNPENRVTQRQKQIATHYTLSD